ncbi:MAG: succinylglutamate desuccinylase/aspartoacylase family protein [Bryobacterales bacterium]|nr:succinylglutamate desuccinylase/aspartoacylase family protein [Bryobacterales bacterium]
MTPEVSLPLLTAEGASAGPVFVVTAGVHGDEYEGVRTIFDFFEDLDTASLSGTILAVPVVNPPAHRAVQRTSPVDGANLARVFPGSPDGTLSERIAHVIASDVISRADFYLDLHSGGVRFAMPSMAGYAALDPRGRAAAEAFGAPVIWGHPVIEPGRTVSVAHARGIPFLYCEAWGAGRIAPGDLRMMRRGISNLLRHLGMTPGRPEIPMAPRRLSGVGNTDAGLTATADGFLLLDVALLDRVETGQRLGRLVDLHGQLIETYHAPCRGTIALTHEMPIVAKGDTLFLLADEE